MHKLLIFLVVTLSIGCAQQVAPTGGPRDEVAPRDSIVIPPNESVNFAGKSIYLEFDEYVRLNDIYSQLVISPPLDTRPEIKLKKKAVTLKFIEDLLPNTTYTLNFGEGIVDYNEGNPAKDLVYVFSTGEELDSLAFWCEISDAYTTEALEGIKVMMYQSAEDSIPFLEKPRYFGLTDENGRCLIKNIREGDYKVCFLEDQNGNYLVDPAERMGFLPDRIAVEAIDSSLTLYKSSISAPLDTLQFISDYSRDSASHVRMVLNSKQLTPRFTVLEDNARDVTWCWSGDSLHAWVGGIPTGDQIRLEVRNGDLVLDTLTLLDYRITPVGTLKLNSNIRGKMRSDSALWISASDWITEIDTSLISIVRDSIEVPFELRRTSDLRKIELIPKMSDGLRYEVMVAPGAVSTRSGYVFDSLQTRISTHEASFYGRLNLALSGFDGENGILEVLDGKANLVFRQNISKDALIKIPRLLPDSYSARLIIDRNNNGKWDPLDYWKGILPEPIYYFPQEINLRSNWVLDFDWILNVETR